MGHREVSSRSGACYLQRLLDPGGCPKQKQMHRFFGIRGPCTGCVVPVVRPPEARLASLPQPRAWLSPQKPNPFHAFGHFQERQVRRQLLLRSCQRLHSNFRHLPVKHEIERCSLLQQSPPSIQRHWLPLLVLPPETTAARAARETLRQNTPTRQLCGEALPANCANPTQSSLLRAMSDYSCRSCCGSQGPLLNALPICAAAMPSVGT
mmetsp:Transcript_17741/g.30765  ORF Transcript_17741/g.30765 Transcript_17741/m.30765 type:complete len:208 (-) Transcript_17741:615-1238(-)